MGSLRAAVRQVAQLRDAVSLQQLRDVLEDIDRHVRSVRIREKRGFLIVTMDGFEPLTVQMPDGNARVRRRSVDMLIVRCVELGLWEEEP